MEFSPFVDYFGLNALVTRLANASNNNVSFSASVGTPPSPTIPANAIPVPWSTIAQVSPTPSVAGSCGTVGSGSPPSSGPENTSLQPFDIIALSRVYADKSGRRRRKPLTHCVFCKNNMETERVYSSHTLKDDSFRVTCPILRAYTCPICGANGDRAHTIKYCPENTGQIHH